MKQLACPLCEVPYKYSEYEGVLIANCPECGGTKLGRENFWFIVHHEIVKFQRRSCIAMLRRNLSSAKVRSEETRRLYCSKCQVQMTPQRFAIDSMIVIDRCSSCQDIFLDRGELVDVQMFAEGTRLLALNLKKST